MKHCKPDITVYRVIAAVTKLERAWNLALVLQIVQKNSQKYFPCLYLSIDQVWWVNECSLSHVLILTMTSHIW